MGSRIIILDESIVKKIAAGEVIERPASVVKELVENSLDAGADSIEVRVKESGKKYISVRDNGCGMNEEEAKLSILRHSTSKIKTLDDLFSIKTLGFRGEALPSIATVSFLTLITKDKESEIGTKLEVEGGKIKKIEKLATPQGCEVIVQNLFYNTPARLKHLKSNWTEMFHISNIVTVYSLISSEISFKLYQDGIQIFNSPKTNSLKEKILYSFGREVFEKMIYIEGENGEIKIKGFISLPELNRSNRYNQIFFVNSRWVKNKIFNISLEEGYREYLQKERYPVCIIYFEIPENLIDVNVHPTKMEIRISQEENLKNLIRETVKNSLNNLKKVKYFEIEKEVEKREINSVPQIKETKISYLAKEKIQEELFFKKDFQLVGQIYSTYIIVEEKDRILIIDQHTLQERYLFEYLKKNKRKINVQNLLYPIVIQVTPFEYILLKNNIDFFKEFGFQIEEFGNNSFILRSVPYIFTRIKNEQDFRELLESIYPEIERKDEEKLLKKIACKSSIKAGDNLEKEEIYKLLEYFEKLDNSYTCPHGRPLMIEITKSELDKKFLRK
jgi:DNA mismatch repair protein MutL